jgi:deazaflavin-dependent oxidoreductase (nitroreductase family)
MIDQPQAAGGTPSAVQPAPPKGVLGALLGVPRYLYRAHLGALLGHRFLLLEHQGRRSGRIYQTPLEVVHYDRAAQEAVVAAGWGQKTQWLHNVEAGLAREVRIGRERYVPAYRRLSVEEAMSVIGWYERNSGLPKALVRAVLSRLVGWHYDGSRDGRRRLVEQLPLLAFRPASVTTDEA